MAYDALPREATEAKDDLVCTVLKDAVNAKAIPQKRIDFALDLIAAHAKYGSWTEKQNWWARFIYADALGLLDKPEEKSVEVGTFEGVYSLFKKAREHLKFPAISLQTPDGLPVKLTISGQMSKAPNMVNVTDGKPFGENKWYGRVDQSGHWQQNRKIEQGEMDQIAVILGELSSDPVGTAKKYAVLTGRCCFCNSGLTDERSTAAGFGPVCAKHFGLYDEWKKATAVFDQVSS